MNRDTLKAMARKMIRESIEGYKKIYPKLMPRDVKDKIAVLEYLFEFVSEDSTQNK